MYTDLLGERVKVISWESDEVEVCIQSQKIAFYVIPKLPYTICILLEKFCSVQVISMLEYKGICIPYTWEFSLDKNFQHCFAEEFGGINFR
jgi:hypothetical protein